MVKEWFKVLVHDFMKSCIQGPNEPRVTMPNRSKLSKVCGKYNYAKIQIYAMPIFAVCTLESPCSSLKKNQ